MKVSIGSDHGGFELKGALVKALSGSYEMTDRGPADGKGCDYPDYAAQVAKDVALGAADFGVLICRTGMGMSMAANRFQNIRAALCSSVHLLFAIFTPYFCSMISTIVFSVCTIPGDAIRPMCRIVSSAVIPLIP